VVILVLAPKNLVTLALILVRLSKDSKTALKVKKKIIHCTQQVADKSTIDVDAKEKSKQ
jgi:hypothetical protein